MNLLKTIALVIFLMGLSTSLVVHVAYAINENQRRESAPVFGWVNSIMIIGIGLFVFADYLE